MRNYTSVLLRSALFLVILVGCSKSDPAPLGAQVKAKLLAGDVNKTKTWKLTTIGFKVGNGTTQNQSATGCFGDNTYTFSNNSAQAYVANEGASKCSTNSPDLIEQGTWAFTLDGLSLIVGVDQTFSINGLFSPEAIYDNSGSTPVAYPIGYPYPAFVQTLTESSMVLVITNVVVSVTYTYTLTFTV